MQTQPPSEKEQEEGPVRMMNTLAHRMMNTLAH